MNRRIGAFTFLVRDYDEAIAYFTGSLGFNLVEDTKLSEDKRWVLVEPSGGSAMRILLARASTPEQVARIGDQTGGRVFLFLETDDFSRDYTSMKSNGVRFIEEPRRETYGTVAIFEDLYGNRWDLIEYRGQDS